MSQQDFETALQAMDHHDAPKSRGRGTAELLEGNVVLVSDPDTGTTIILPLAAYEQLRKEAEHAYLAGLLTPR